MQACFAPSIWRVGSSQPDADPMLINLKPQTALLVVLDQLTQVGIGGGVGGQALFEFGIVGIDLSGAIVFIEIQFGDYL